MADIKRTKICICLLFFVHCRYANRTEGIQISVIPKF
jgi:hypothetical protein